MIQPAAPSILTLPPGRALPRPAGDAIPFALPDGDAGAILIAGSGAGERHDDAVPGNPLPIDGVVPIEIGRSADLPAIPQSPAAMTTPSDRPRPLSFARLADQPQSILVVAAAAPTERDGSDGEEPTMDSAPASPPGAVSTIPATPVTVDTAPIVPTPSPERPPSTPDASVVSSKTVRRLPVIPLISTSQPPVDVAPTPAATVRGSPSPSVSDRDERRVDVGSSPDLAGQASPIVPVPATDEPAPATNAAPIAAAAPPRNGQPTAVAASHTPTSQPALPADAIAVGTSIRSSDVPAAAAAASPPGVVTIPLDTSVSGAPEPTAPPTDQAIPPRLAPVVAGTLSRRVAVPWRTTAGTVPTTIWSRDAAPVLPVKMTQGGATLSAAFDRIIGDQPVADAHQSRPAVALGASDSPKNVSPPVALPLGWEQGRQTGPSPLAPSPTGAPIAATTVIVPVPPSPVTLPGTVAVQPAERIVVADPGTPPAPRAPLTPPASLPTPSLPPILAAAPAGIVFGAARFAAQTADDRDEPTASIGLAPPAGPAGIDRIATVSAAAQAPLDLRREHWPSAMIERIEMIRDAANEADTRIRLVPDALGAIDVAVQRDGDTLHVRFHADQPQTRALLADAAPRLAEAAEARGMRLGQSSVGGSDGSAAGQNQQPRQPLPTAPPRAPRSPNVEQTADDDTRLA